jgi:hypothetical protein
MHIAAQQYAAREHTDWLPYVAVARLAEDVPDDRARLLEIVRA